MSRTRFGNKRFGSTHIPYKKTPFNDNIKYTFKKLGIKKYKDIILDDITKVKYFNYLIIDLYNRLFINQARKSFDTTARIFADYNEIKCNYKIILNIFYAQMELLIIIKLYLDKKIKLPLTFLKIKILKLKKIFFIII